MNPFLPRLVLIIVFITTESKLRQCMLKRSNLEDRKWLGKAARFSWILLLSEGKHM